MQKHRRSDRVEQDERWGDPVTGFPRVGDEATEEHDKRTKRARSTQGKTFHTTQQAFVHGSSSRGYTFGTFVSGRFESIEEVGVHVRRGTHGLRRR